MVGIKTETGITTITTGVRVALLESPDFSRTGIHRYILRMYLPQVLITIERTIVLYCQECPTDKVPMTVKNS
jgi:hypothetical protein